MTPGPGPTAGLVGGSWQGRDHLSGAAGLDGRDLPPKLNFNPAHKSSSRSPGTAPSRPHPPGLPQAVAGRALGQPSQMLCVAVGQQGLPALRRRGSSEYTGLGVPLAPATRAGPVAGGSLVLG